MRGQGLWARFVNIARAAATGGQVCAPANGTRNYAGAGVPSVIQRQRTEEEDASVALLGYMCLDPRQPWD
jgi:hypothetical protein